MLIWRLKKQLLIKFKSFSNTIANNSVRNEGKLKFRAKALSLDHY